MPLLTQSHPLRANALNLLAGFSGVQPRTISGAVFNVGRDGWEDTADCLAAMAELIRAGAVVSSGSAGGQSWLLAA